MDEPRERSRALLPERPVYQDYRTHTGPLPEEDQAILDGYVKQLGNFATEGEGDAAPTPIAPTPTEWDQRVTNLYRGIVFDAFQSRLGRLPQGMELIVAGSLAKQQATMYSDIDAIAIFRDEGEATLAIEVFKSVNNICRRIYEATRQLYPDPAGLNPERFCGTVDGLMARLRDTDDPTFIDPTAFIVALSSGRPLGGHSDLYQSLMSGIRADPYLGGSLQPDALYRRAVNDFPAPNTAWQEINLKATVLRPLDFILMGLREEFKIPSEEDGSNLSAARTLAYLREKHRSDIDEAALHLIESTFNEAMDLRFRLHRERGGEHDSILQAEHGSLLGRVQQLRLFASERMALIRGNRNEAVKLREDRIAAQDAASLAATAAATIANADFLAERPPRGPAAAAPFERRDANALPRVEAARAAPAPLALGRAERNERRPAEPLTQPSSAWWKPAGLGFLLGAGAAGSIYLTMGLGFLAIGGMASVLGPIGLPIIVVAAFGVVGSGIAWLVNKGIEWVQSRNKLASTPPIALPAALEGPVPEDEVVAARNPYLVPELQVAHGNAPAPEAQEQIAEQPAVEPVNVDEHTYAGDNIGYGAVDLPPNRGGPR